MELSKLKQKYPQAETFKFGDNEMLSQELLALVRAGKKTATCGALRDFEQGEEALPVVGGMDIALNWDGTPSVVIETMQVDIVRYCDVDAGFALSEGENDTLDGWKQDHKRYFESNNGFDPEMELVCESFRLVEVIDQHRGEN